VRKATNPGHLAASSAGGNRLICAAPAPAVAVIATSK